MQAIPLKNRNANCERLLKQNLPLGGGRGGGLELTQVMDDAVHLTGCESALAAGVAELGELFGERLTKLNP